MQQWDSLCVHEWQSLFAHLDLIAFTDNIYNIQFAFYEKWIKWLICMVIFLFDHISVFFRKIV